ncbi:MAG TPA: SpoIIE family protein phosphatase [Actinoplanes sp.]|nr:SpoIIE family protein phosphatase [Actinoplanes sp.]
MSDPFEAAGAMRETYQQVDWAATSLGPVRSWSPALSAAVNLMVRSRIAATLLWGPEFVLLYNEAYIPILAEKHPWALGRTAREVFPEVWADIAPLLQSVITGRGTVFIEDLRLLIQRHHMLQESFFTFSYSAVAAADGTIEGVLDIVAETTAQVTTHRRLALLSRLISHVTDLDDPQDFVEHSLTVLRSSPEDLAAVDLRIPGVTAPVPAEEPDDRTVVVRLAADRPAGDGALVVRVGEHLAPDTAYREFLALVAGTLEQGWSRVRARQDERRSALLEREMSEALQRSLLTVPVQIDHLQVAVRYQPAAEQAQVGGDWYDSFLLPNRTLTVVVGDITGHDRYSAAAMAQVRNLARGVTYTSQEPPSRLLNALNAAMLGLAVDALATMILAQLDQSPADIEDGRYRLRWSNAGHPPPLLLHGDGTVEVLHTRPETLLGTRSAVTRTDHVVTLERGSTVVFYTDGLVERRHTTLDEGISELTTLLTGRHDRNAEQICDLLLEHFGYTTEDDIVLAVVHVRADP